MNITVVGLGKIGLPLAAQFADRGHQVTGIDINAETVHVVNRGQAPFPGEAHLDKYLDRLVGAGLLSATTKYAEGIPGADAVVVVVPLFVDEDSKPDFGWMDSATADIADNLTEGTLVVYETTLPVGTTRGRWKPMLENRSGLQEGSDFHLVFSPERVLTGRVFEDLRKYPKLIGGLSGSGAAAAKDFYEAVLEFDERPDLERGNGVWDLGSAEAAEMAKLAETTYRDVNIGLANQFAVFAERSGIDVHQVIAASNSQPYSHIHTPGVSVGGHCIPVYPRLYLSNDPTATVVSSARDANQRMPSQAASTIAQELGDLNGIPILVLGASYRPGVKESAFSGVFDLVNELTAIGADVFVHDPLYSEAELAELGLKSTSGFDKIRVIVLHTAHDEYTRLSPVSFPDLKLVYDGRGTFSYGFGEVPVYRLGVGFRAVPPQVEIATAPASRPARSGTAETH